jgi:hypothetical protein
MNKENEKILLETFLELNNNIEKAQQYIKENYHINSEYAEDEETLYIWSPNVNESLNLAAAKEYIQETIGNEFIDVIYGKKQ